jgi:hypothetical protein
MSSVVFHIESQELDNKFLKNLKSLFKGQKLMITVTPEPKDITNPELLEKIRRSEQSKGYTVPSDDFNALVDRFEKNDDFDIAEAIKTYKNS